MKKKTIFIGLAALLLSMGSMVKISPEIEASARRVDYVGYVSSSEKPVIDGTIDEIWKDAGRLVTSQGYASVLWNESGIYYLAYVYDNYICSKDSCTFWISEDYYLSNLWLEYYSADGGYQADGKSGAYYVTMSANGAMSASCTDSNKYKAIKYASSKNSGYWIAEIFVPRMGTKTRLAEYERIGFEFTIDGYDSNYDSSVSRSKWMSNNNWPYNTNHTALGKLVLSKSNEDADIEFAEELVLEEDQNACVTPINKTNLLATAKESDSCSSSIVGSIGLGGLLGGFFVLIKKKNSKR